MDKLKALNIAPQTKIASVGFSLIIIVQLIIIVRMIFSSNEVLKLTMGISVISFIAQLFLVVVALYALNCTVVGKCNLYAWIVGYLVATMGILFVGSMCVLIWNLY